MNHKGEIDPCKYCGKKFKVLHNLHIHWGNCLKNTDGLKPFVCDCKASFSRETALKAHQNYCGVNDNDSPVSKKMKTTNSSCLSSTSSVESFSSSVPDILIPFPTKTPEEIDENGKKGLKENFICNNFPDQCICNCDKSHYTKIKQHTIGEMEKEVSDFVTFFMEFKKNPNSVYENQETSTFLQWLETHRCNTVESTNELLYMLKSDEFDVNNLPNNYKEINKLKKKFQLIYREVEIFKNPSKSICHIPIMVIIQRWLLQPGRYEMMKLQFEPKYDPLTSERIYADVWDSLWMEEKKELLEEWSHYGASILPVFLWGDSTGTSNFGKQSIHPLVTSCGADTLHGRDVNSGKSLLALCPQVRAHDILHDAKEVGSDVRLHLLHQCNRACLEDLKTVENSKEGFWFHVPDGQNGYELKLIFPFLCSLIGDIPEHKKNCCKYSGGDDKRQSKPCWTCNIDGGNLNQSNPKANLRDQLSYRELHSTLLDIKYMRPDNKEFHRLSQLYSYNLESSVLLEFDHFNLATDVAIDVDHTLHFGIGQLMIHNFRAVMMHHFGKKSADTACAEILHRFEHFCSKACGMSMYLFPDNIWSIEPKEKTMETYKRIIMYLTPLLVTYLDDRKYFLCKKDKEKYNNLKDLRTCFVSYHMIQKMFFKTSIKESELQSLEMNITIFMEKMVSIYGPCDTSELKLIKFHKFLEFIPQIRRFGRLRNTSTGRYEAQNRIMKKEFQATNKKSSYLKDMFKNITRKELQQFVAPLSTAAVHSNSHKLSNENQLLSIHSIVKKDPRFKNFFHDLTTFCSQESSSQNITDEDDLEDRKLTLDSRIKMFKSIHIDKEGEWSSMVKDSKIFSTSQFFHKVPKTLQNLVVMNNGLEVPWFANIMFIFTLPIIDEPLIYFKWMETEQKRDDELGLWVCKRSTNMKNCIQRVSSVSGRIHVFYSEMDRLYYIIE